MPWVAQREDLPDTHKHHVDAGSDLERTYIEGLGYVEVPAPKHAEEATEHDADDFGDPVPDVGGEIPSGDTYADTE